MKRLLAAMMVTVAAAPAVWAEDLALIIANEFYRNQPRVGDTRAIVDLERDLRSAGFTVQRISNTRSDQAASNLDEMWRRLDQADHAIVVLSGHVVTSGGEGWLLNTDADRLNPFNIGRSALPIRGFMDIAAGKPGDMVIAIAGSSARQAMGGGITAGYQPERLEQGVTVFTGDQRQIASLVSNQLLQPGQTLAGAANAAPRGVGAYGFLSRSRGVVPESSGPSAAEAIERAFWQHTENLNTADAYQDYIARYPSGLFVDEAQQRYADLSLTPQDRARIEEENLRLSQEQRRSVQRNLTLIGFDTAGVDGILGGRSRTAIANWQASLGILPTGYLTANQIVQIETAGAIRAEELRREADRRRQEEERRDRRYWNNTGASGDENGLWAYLQRYPDGIFANQAKDQLQAIERDRRRQAREAERQAWDQAVMQGTLQSYQQYLNDYPNGSFVREAQAQVASLSQPETSPQIVAAARAEEDRMNLNGFTRSLIEGQLQALELDPGPVDGRFTEETRRALRKYQRANSMDVTGYVTRDTIVLLLASAVIKN